MSYALYAAWVCFVLGAALIYLAWRGLGPGETVSLDDVTLYSPRLRLIGRPDRIAREGENLIPEEWKSSKRLSEEHTLQLGTCFLLIEERYGARPLHGFVVLGDGSRRRVENTEELCSEVLRIAERIREHRRNLAREIPVEQPAWKCRRCGQRKNWRCTLAKLVSDTVKPFGVGVLPDHSRHALARRRRLPVMRFRFGRQEWPRRHPTRPSTVRVQGLPQAVRRPDRDRLRRPPPAVADVDRMLVSHGSKSLGIVDRPRVGDRQVRRPRHDHDAPPRDRRPDPAGGTLRRGRMRRSLCDGGT